MWGASYVLTWVSPSLLRCPRIDTKCCGVWPVLGMRPSADLGLFRSDLIFLELLSWKSG